MSDKESEFVDVAQRIVSVLGICAWGILVNVSVRLIVRVQSFMYFQFSRLS